MSEYEEQTRGFKVTDRRSFTSEGERRLPDESQDDSEEPLATSEQAAGAHQTEGLEETESRSAVPDERFFDLLSLLTTQASLHLGEPHPATGQSHEDLPSAQMLISLIEVLQTKTKGNLARDEERALEDVLYQLRMQFTAKAKRSKP